MKAADVHVGEIYEVKVSGILARVKITGKSPYGGWNGINTATGREIRIKTGGRLRSNLTVREAVATGKGLAHLGRSIRDGDIPDIEQGEKLASRTS